MAVVVDQPNSASEVLREVFSALAAQDYPNIQILVLLTGSDAAEFELVHEIAQAQGSDPSTRQPHIYQIGANPGFGLAANTVLRLVEGDSGFFLLMHDDVVLAPDAIRLLVEELYRSNAGMVAQSSSSGMKLDGCRRWALIVIGSVNSTVQLSPTNLIKNNMTQCVTCLYCLHHVCLSVLTSFANLEVLNLPSSFLVKILICVGGLIFRVLVSLLFLPRLLVIAP